MPTPVNAPVSLKYVSAEANSGGNYDLFIESSVNNIVTDWRAASTPVWNAVKGKTKFISGHFVVRVHNKGYATPTELVHTTHRAVVSVAHSSAVFPKGQQTFANFGETAINHALTLATPIT